MCIYNNAIYLKNYFYWYLYIAFYSSIAVILTQYNQQFLNSVPRKSYKYVSGKLKDETYMHFKRYKASICFSDIFVHSCAKLGQQVTRTLK